MTNRWPPQPGDLVKVESRTHPKIASCHAMLGAVCEIRAQFHNDMYEVWQQDKRDFWCFKLSDLSPATPPQTIERWGRTYRLDEEVCPEKIEAAIDAVLKARSWRHRAWREPAIGMFQCDGEDGEPVRHVVRDHEAEQEQDKVVILFSSSDLDASEREYERAIVRRELRAALAAMSATTESRHEDDPDAGL